MTARATKKRGRIVRYKSLDDMPPPKPLSKMLREMTDKEVERRAAADPNAGVIPPGFWDNATVYVPENKQQITLRRGQTQAKRVTRHTRTVAGTVVSSSV